MSDKVRISRSEATPGTGEPPLGRTDVGKALRSVYQCTIEEDIPAELLDLLGKLN